MAFRFVSFLFFVFNVTLVYSQSYFTRYDDLPCIQKSIKPAYDESFPEWAKMLYNYPINYNSIEQAYKNDNFGASKNRSAIHKYYKLWKRCILTYVEPNGEIILPPLDEIHFVNNQNADKIKQSITPKSLINEKWTFLGPKQTFWLNEEGATSPPAPCPWQVNVYAIDIAPSNHNIVFAGTETGFLNKSIDYGITWEMVASHYYFGGAITALAIHPTNPQIVYVSAGNQIHKSMDGGQSWSPKLGTQKFGADKIRIDSTNPTKLFAATSSGIYLSSDDGETWQKKWDQPTWDLQFHPSNVNIIYGVTTVNGIFTIVSSQDGGLNFSRISSFPTNIKQADGALLAVTPANPNLIMAILLSDNDTPHLVKGIKNGTDWSWNTIAKGKTSTFPMDNWQGYFDLVLEISPNNENIIFTGTASLYKSTNGGASFNIIGGYGGDFSIHPDIQDIKILENDHVWVATDGGINFSSDGFQKQQNYRASVNGLAGSDFWGFDQGWNEDIIVGGRYHNGNTAITDFYGDKALRMGGAESPTGWVLNGKPRQVAFNDLGNGWILPKKPEEKPEGRFIFSKFPNMDEYGGRRSNLLHHPNYFSTLYLGEGTGLWRSLDAGINWELIYDFPDRAMYMEISHTQPDVIYVDVVGKGLYKSEDGGHTFVHKPSSVSSALGGSYWGGKLHFQLSPIDPNIIYVCQQNGTWSADKGRIIVSKDGGDTWTNWTDNISAYLKSILIQPGADGKDIVYLFTNARNNQSSNVYFRKTDSSEWLPIDMDYPAGMSVNIPKIFYRDSKIRVSGNAGIWEYPLIDTSYQPLVQPWVEKAIVECVTDTIQLEDHSIIDHKNTSWKWQINPAPQWIEDSNMRNPKVVFGAIAEYDILLSITKNGILYEKSIKSLVKTKSCPSVDDCNNPAFIAKKDWKLIYANSQEVNDPGLATMSFDDNPNTIWHTRWSTGNDPYPHEIQIDLNENYLLSAFEYLNRQDGENGRIKEYELYLSSDTTVWGQPVANGQFINTSAPQIIHFAPVKARYLRLVAISEVNDGPWASAAEFNLKGCYEKSSNTTITQFSEDIKASPVPTSGNVDISIPETDIANLLIYNTQGKCFNDTKYINQDGKISVDLSHLPSGLYIIHIQTYSQRNYKVKVIR